MYNILNMTFSASLMIIIIEIMRRFTQNRVSRRVFYGLWMLAAIRMIVPFGIPFGFSFDSGSGSLSSSEGITAAN